MKHFCLYPGPLFFLYRRRGIPRNQPEHPAEMRQIAESAGIARLGYRASLLSKHRGGLFYPVFIEVAYKCLPRMHAEETAECSPVHPDILRYFGNTYTAAVIARNVSPHPVKPDFLLPGKRLHPDNAPDIHMAEGIGQAEQNAD